MQDRSTSAPSAGDKRAEIVDMLCTLDRDELIEATAGILAVVDGANPPDDQGRAVLRAWLSERGYMKRATTYLGKSARASSAN